MLKHYLLWRIRRQKRAGVYKINRRDSESVFGSGFYGFLDQTRFSQPAGLHRRSRVLWRLAFKLVFIFAALGFVVWGALESFKALQVF